MKEINAIGLACPAPVLMAKKAADEGTAEFAVVVDDSSSAENIVRFAKSAGYSAEITRAGADFRVILSSAGGAAEGIACETAAVKTGAGKVLFISTDKVGRGDDPLGEILMKSLLNALAEKDEPPEKIVLMNAGVKLACEGADTAQALNALSGRGVEVLACGTCLKHFGLTEQLRAGRVSNAYEILEVLLAGDVLTWA